jgi:arginine decarboxylase-like protein
LVENRGCALVASSQNERQFNYRTRQMFCRDGMERVLRKPKTWSDNLLRVNRAGQIFILKMVKENHTASLRAIAEAYSDAGYGLISHEWVRTVLKRSGYRREWRRHA